MRTFDNSTMASSASTTSKPRTWIHNSANCSRLSLNVLRALERQCRACQAPTQVCTSATSQSTTSLCRRVIPTTYTVIHRLAQERRSCRIESAMFSTYMVPGKVELFLPVMMIMLTPDYSFTLDTACSSSVYALHQALSAIKVGDCESAVVASANLIMSPELHIGAAKSGVLSPTGTCHTFDASADGYGRAEGVNAIYVKRLSAALRDGNQIRAIVRGSAVNA